MESDKSTVSVTVVISTNTLMLIHHDIACGDEAGNTSANVNAKFPNVRFSKILFLKWNGHCPGCIGIHIQYTSLSQDANA